MTQIIAETAMSLILCQMTDREKNDHVRVQSHFVPCSFLFFSWDKQMQRARNIMDTTVFFVLCCFSFTEYPPENSEMHYFWVQF